MNDKEDRMSDRSLNLTEAFEEASENNKYFWRILIFCGVGIFTEGGVILAISSTIRTLQIHWDWSNQLCAFVTALFFFGFFVGGVCGGSFCDMYGRRPGILLSSSVLVIFGMLRVTFSTVVELGFWNFFSGVGAGGLVATVWSLIIECSPAPLRKLVWGIPNCVFTCGEIVVCLELLVLMPDLQPGPTLKTWGIVNATVLIPLALAIPVMYFWLHETPRWLLLHGKTDETVAVLNAIAETNGNGKQIARIPRSEEPTPELIAEQAGLRAGRFRRISRPMIYLTCFGVFLCVLVNFAFFGSSYVYTEIAMVVVPQMSQTGLSEAEVLLLLIVAEIPGLLFLLAVLEGGEDVLPALTNSAVVVSFSSFGLIAIDYKMWVLGITAACASKVSLTLYFGCAYIFLMERFPIFSRATLFGICSGCGRLGCALAPELFELLANRQETPPTHVAFYVVLGVAFAAVVVALCMIWHTRFGRLTPEGEDTYLASQLPEDRQKFIVKVSERNSSGNPPPAG